MCSEILCVQEKTLHYFTIDRTEYQCPQCESMCQVLNISFEEQTNSFFLKFDQGMYVFKGTKKSIQMLLEMCIVQNVQTKSVFTEVVVFTTTVKSAKLALLC